MVKILEKKSLKAVLLVGLLVGYLYEQNKVLGFNNNEINGYQELEKKLDKIPVPSFEVRENSWNERSKLLRERGEKEPEITEKYVFDELVVIGFEQQLLDRLVILTPKDNPTFVIYAKVGQTFWNSQIIKITDSCVEIEEQIFYCSPCKKIYIRTLCSD
jgi:hypothetical protein